MPASRRFTFALAWWHARDAKNLVGATLKPVRVHTSSPEETQELAERLAPLLSAGDIITLGGELGAGKTCFTQGLARGLGVVGRVQSPTFTLLRQHVGRLPLHHFDLYRLDAQELAALGFEEIFYGNGITVIEWGEKAASLLPRDHLALDFEIVNQTRRNISVKVPSPRWARALRQWLDLKTR